MPLIGRETKLNAVKVLAALAVAVVLGALLGVAIARRALAPAIADGVVLVAVLGFVVNGLMSRRP